MWVQSIAMSDLGHFALTCRTHRNQLLHVLTGENLHLLAIA